MQTAVSYDWNISKKWYWYHYVGEWNTKNIFYAYLIIEISLKHYKFIFYNFDDITAANHKPITLRSIGLEWVEFVVFQWYLNN